jgi:hypothetical protein
MAASYRQQWQFKFEYCDRGGLTCWRMTLVLVACSVKTSVIGIKRSVVPAETTS